MKKALTVLLVFSVLLSSMSAVWGEETQIKFSDIPEDYWAKDVVEWAVEKNLVQGFPDGTFRPNKEITVAEWAAFIYRLYCDDGWFTKSMAEGWQKKLYGEINDVKKNDWYYTYMIWFTFGFAGWPCFDLDYINGHNFKPNHIMPRWLVADSIYTQFIRYSEGYKSNDGRVFFKGPEEINPIFDYDYLAEAINEDYAFEDLKKLEDINMDLAVWSPNRPPVQLEVRDVIYDIYLLKKAGLVNGFPDNTFRPNASISRIEALTLLKRVYPYIDKSRIKAIIEKDFRQNGLGDLLK